MSTDAVCALKPVILEIFARDSSPWRRKHCRINFVFCEYSMRTLIGRKMAGVKGFAGEVDKVNLLAN